MVYQEIIKFKLVDNFLSNYLRLSPAPSSLRHRYCQRTLSGEGSQAPGEDYQGACAFLTS
jgi:hypothetical protein